MISGRRPFRPNSHFYRERRKGGAPMHPPRTRFNPFVGLVRAIVGRFLRKKC